MNRLEASYRLTDYERIGRLEIRYYQNPEKSERRRVSPPGVSASGPGESLRNSPTYGDHF
jgi:hypothetical protein